MIIGTIPFIKGALLDSIEPVSGSFINALSPIHKATITTTTTNNDNKAYFIPLFSSSLNSCISLSFVESLYFVKRGAINFSVTNAPAKVKTIADIKAK